MNRSKNTSPASKSDKVDVRLDKWLWACRFYKTRALAKAAIEGGKVNYQGAKPKPGKLVHVGDQVKVRQGFDEKTVRVEALSDRRQSASIAQSLYKETADSIKSRQEIANLRKLSAPSTQGKPDKKQRRQIHRFKDVMSSGFDE